MTERIRINKALLTVAQSGKTVVHLYAPGAQYARFPVLTLFDLGLLINVGIDPNSTEFQKGDAVHCNIWAHYERGEKLNKQGNPYKNVVALERVDALATTTSTDTSAILGELRAIKTLLLELAAGSPPPAAERIRKLNHVGSPADPQATDPEPEPELSEREAMMEFHALVEPAIAEGRLQATDANDLSQAAGNGGQGWIAALASLKELLDN